MWREEWVVDCQPVGNGETALKYLAPYVFRVAISNNRIEKLENDAVTYRYKESASGQMRRCTLPVEEFMRRFLQHVLPRGFVKVRYYGFFAPGNRHRLAQVRSLLGQRPKPPTAHESARTPHQPSQLPTARTVANRCVGWRRCRAAVPSATLPPESLWRSSS